MPRYFFNLADGRRERDDQGLELPDDAAAKIAATAFAGEILKDSPRSIWNTGPVRVDVTNATGTLLWTVLTLGIDAPRPRPMLVRD